MNASDQDSLKLSFRDVAQQVLRYHPSTSLLASVDLDDLSQVIYAVKAWLDLQKNKGWLTIYDNYDNPKIPGILDPSAFDIRQFLPCSDQGSIIITTRSSRVSQGYRVHVQKLLDIKEGLEILSNMSGRKDISNDVDAIKLVKELDGLPLALSTAGAYLEHVTTSFSDYLRLYRASWLKLQKFSPQLSSYEDRSLYTTWQITFDRIKQQNPLAANLLKLWAYFDRQDIWYELLRHTSSADDEWVQKLTEDELSFNAAITLLSTFGLVDPDRSQQFRSGGYSVHSCVHSWTVFVLNEEWDDGLARLALHCVASKIPTEAQTDSWILSRRLLQHAIRQERAILKNKMDMKGMEWALDKLGILYAVEGKPAEAEAMCTRALESKEEALGPKHTSTLDTVNNLGNFYAKHGKLAEAETMYIRALQGREEALGPKHISTLDSVNNLGVLYFAQGKLAEAEVICTRSLQGREEALGPKHALTLDSVHNLGTLYFVQGKLAEAEAMYTRALQGYEDAVAPEPVSLYLPALNTMILFGDFLSQTGRKDTAKEIYARALSGYTNIQGPSSKRCKQLENRLQALEVASTESEIEQNELAEPGAAKSRSFK